MIEDVIEPYLMQQGLVQRTPRGRVLADAGYRHLGLAAPRRAPTSSICSTAPTRAMGARRRPRAGPTWTAREHVFPGARLFRGHRRGRHRLSRQLLEVCRAGPYRDAPFARPRSVRSLAEQDIGFTVRRCEVDYLAPARLDDTLEVRTRLIDVRGASLKLAQTVSRGGTALAQLTLRIACMHRSGRPVRLPETIGPPSKLLPSPLRAAPNSELLQHGSLD